MTMIPSPEQIRAFIERRVLERGTSLAAASRAIGKNEAYLQQFVKRGTPRQLGENDRRRLAMHLSVDERLLGARDPWAPASEDA
jgi:hypothetical protein